MSPRPLSAAAAELGSAAAISSGSTLWRRRQRLRPRQLVRWRRRRRCAGGGCGCRTGHRCTAGSPGRRRQQRGRRGRRRCFHRCSTGAAADLPELQFVHVLLQSTLCIVRVCCQCHHTYMRLSHCIVRTCTRQARDEADCAQAFAARLAARDGGESQRSPAEQMNRQGAFAPPSSLYSSPSGGPPGGGYGGGGRGGGRGYGGGHGGHGGGGRGV